MNQPECFEHVQNIRDGLPNQPKCSMNVTNALRISPNAPQIMIRTTFELIPTQCDWVLTLPLSVWIYNAIKSMSQMMLVTMVTS